jgi:hypothetical protein
MKSVRRRHKPDTVAVEDAKTRAKRSILTILSELPREEAIDILAVLFLDRYCRHRNGNKP